MKRMLGCLLVAAVACLALPAAVHAMEVVPVVLQAPDVGASLLLASAAIGAPVADGVAVRAKFKVVSVTEHEGDIKTAKLQAVSSGSAENAEFFKWTPSASIDLSTMNPAAAKHFVPGKQFYVDFTEATG